MCAHVFVCLPTVSCVFRFRFVCVPIASLCCFMSSIVFFYVFLGVFIWCLVRSCDPLCFIMFVSVTLWFPMWFLSVLHCSYICVHLLSCLVACGLVISVVCVHAPMASYVFWCFRLFSCASLQLPMQISVSHGFLLCSCGLWFVVHVVLCVPMFPCVFLCFLWLPMFTYVCLCMLMCSSGCFCVCVPWLSYVFLSYVFLWSPLCSYVSVWFPMCSYVFQHVIFGFPMTSYAHYVFLCLLLCSYGFLCVIVFSCLLVGLPIWSPMFSCVFLLIHNVFPGCPMVSNGFLCSRWFPMFSYMLE